MSYILDAVRKAETERREQQSPLVYSLQSSSPVRGVIEQTSWPKWLLIGALAFILLNVMVWQYSRLAGTLPSFDSLSINSSSEAPVNESLRYGEGRSNAEFEQSSTTMPRHSSGNETSQVKLWQASAAAQTAIGALDFSFHVYSADPKRRTIIINGQRMSEGSQISAALQLEAITERGVLIRHAEALVDVEILQQW